MTTLSKLSFQEKGHGLFRERERKHDEKEIWTHEGPSIQKKKKRELDT